MTAIAPLKITVPPPDVQASAPAATSAFWGQEGLSFGTLLDIINPLQQLPIVSTIYRSMTGDTISTGARLAGGALMGGPLGFAGALFNEILKSATGRDAGETALALATGDESFQVAQAYGDDLPIGANQRAAYNSYVSVQNLLA